MLSIPAILEDGGFFVLGGVFEKGCFFYRFLVLRLHKKALIPRLFPVVFRCPLQGFGKDFHIESN